MNLIDMHCDTVMQLFHRKAEKILRITSLASVYPE